MAKQPTPNFLQPGTSKMPLGAFIQQLNVPGMNAEQTRQAALLIHTGNASVPTGSK